LDDLNRRNQEGHAHSPRVLATGGMLPSGFSLRPAIVNWRTGSDDVRALVEETVRLGEELE
jgi:hypothetical protein